MSEKGLFLIFSQKCNLNCSYCYEKNKCSGNFDIIEKNLDNILTVLKTREDINDITILGGEIFLDKNNLLKFLENIDQINSKRINCIEVYIITNGTIYLKELKQFKSFITLQISLDGGKEHHNKYRKDFSKKGSYDIVIRNLRKYYTDDIKINLHTVVKDFNLWKRSLSQFFKDIPPKLPLGIKFAYGKETFIESFKNIFYYIKTTNYIYRKGFGSKSSCSSVCQAGRYHVTLDLNVGKFYYCQECTSYNNLDKDFFEIGNLNKSQININPDKLKKVLDYSILQNYRLHFLPKTISSLLLSYFHIEICPLRNQEITKKWNVIPLRFLFLGIARRIYR